MALAATMSNKINRVLQTAPCLEDKKFTFIQQNCQKAEAAWYGALESGLEMGVDMVLLQEQPTFGGYRHDGYELVSAEG
jgi:hypothetical protein